MSGYQEEKLLHLFLEGSLCHPEDEADLAATAICKGATCCLHLGIFSRLWGRYSWPWTVVDTCVDSTSGVVQTRLYNPGRKLSKLCVRHGSPKLQAGDRAAACVWTWLQRILASSPGTPQMLTVGCRFIIILILTQLLINSENLIRSFLALDVQFPHLELGRDDIQFPELPWGKDEIREVTMLLRETWEHNWLGGTAPCL